MRILDRISALLLHGIFAVLAVMSILLYKERLFADASYYLFHLVNDGGLHVEHGRVVLGLSQILPYLGYLLGLPLKLIMILSSFGHELFYYLLFLLIYYKLKDRFSAIALILIHVIGQLWLYYSPMYEICYGAALTITFYSLLKSEKIRDDKWFILMILCLWFAITSHLENTVLVFFVLLYDLFDRGYKQREHLSSFVLLGGGIVLEFLTLTNYEKQNISTPFNEDATALNLLNSEYLGDLWSLFAGYFPELLFFGTVATLLMLVKKQIKKAIIFLGAVGFLLLIINNKANATEFIRYFESMYNPLVLLCVFVFIFEVLKRASAKVRSISTLLLIVVALLRVTWIWSYGEPLRERSAQLERLVDYAQSLGKSKYLLHKENFEKDYSFVNWATPVEALLFSAIDGKENTITISTIDDLEYGQNKQKLKEDNFMFRRSDIMDLSELNEKYFQLDVEPYHALNTSTFEQDYNTFKADISVLPISDTEKLNFKAGDTSWVRVNITTATSKRLPSQLSSNVFIAYHWYKDGKVVHWDGIRTPLEVDVLYAYQQDVKVAMPEEAGLYELQFDIVIEGKAWFELQEKTEVDLTYY